MENIKDYVHRIKELYKTNYAEELASINFVIVQVGNVEASNRYVRNKIKDCNELGIKGEVKHFDETITEDELLGELNNLNDNPLVTCYMVQFPLPRHINQKHIEAAIAPEKDADGFTGVYTNPCTPMGIIRYLERQDYPFEGKNAVIFGRSDIVGKPMAKLLLEKDCNITVLHSKTSRVDKKEYLRTADLVIAATGHKNLITIDDLDYYYHDDIVLFDVGINFNEEGKIVGDCQKDLPVKWQSPVPGGVGLLTRLQLLENIYYLYNIFHSEGKYVGMAEGL